jgi:hypothetical protein
VNLLVSLSCMLEIVHALIKFAQKWGIFVWLCCNHQNLSRITLLLLFRSCHKICLWCFQRIPRFGCLQSQQNAFEMQGDIIWTSIPHVLNMYALIQWASLSKLLA